MGVIQRRLKCSFFHSKMIVINDIFLRSITTKDRENSKWHECSIDVTIYQKKLSTTKILSMK